MKRKRLTKVSHRAAREAEKGAEREAVAWRVVVDSVYRFAELSRSPSKERVRAVQLGEVIAAHVAAVLSACGGSVSLAADVLGMHRRTLQRVRRKPEKHWQLQRGPAPPPRPTVTPKVSRARKIDPARVAMLRKSGMKWRQIAEEIGCTLQGARQALLRHDLSFRERQ